MSNSISYSLPKWDLWMVAALVCVAYDRIAHFAVGWFAFPLAELFSRKNLVKSAGFAAFFMPTVCQGIRYNIMRAHGECPCGLILRCF